MIKVDESDPVGELEPSFPYKDITIRRGIDMKEHYELQSEIGRGKFGTVFKCREKATGLMLAAKFVGIVHKQDRRNVEREVEIMCELQHPRLIQLYDAFESNNAMCFILELVEGGELFERVIGDDFVLTEKAVTIFMRQICEGVQFIHSKNILHLDLKPENILCLTKTGNRIKIIDFGLARKFNPENKLQVLFGTPEFVAPEVVNFDAIGFGTDMWSVGVICYVLLSGLSPFMGETDVETMANVTIAQYDFDDEAFDSISNDAKDFIKKLLVKDHKSRPTATECLAHRWMTQKKKSKKTVRAKPTQIRQKGIECAAEAARDALLPLSASKENLKELCSGTKSRSQSPTAAAAAPAPSPKNSTRLLHIRNDDEPSPRSSPPPPSPSFSDGTTARSKAAAAAAESASSRPNRDDDARSGGDAAAVIDDRADASLPVVVVGPAGGSPQTAAGADQRDYGDGSRASADRTDAAPSDGPQPSPPTSAAGHRTKCEPPKAGAADVPSRVTVGGQMTTTWSSKTWTTTTNNDNNDNNSGYRRASDVCTSYRVFSSFRSGSVAADGFLESELRGLSDRLQTMFDGRTAESADDLHALLSNRSERKTKFKFVNRDVPVGSPLDREPAAYKEMLLKLFYGGAAADKTAAAAAEPKLST